MIPGYEPCICNHCVGANILLRHPPHVPAAERAALTPSPALALRAALTPSPSPALREKGDLMAAKRAPHVLPTSGESCAQASFRSSLLLPSTVRTLKNPIDHHHSCEVGRAVLKYGCWRRSKVVMQRSAKPPFAGSIPAVASRLFC